jgi:hypothetical protein
VDTALAPVKDVETSEIPEIAATYGMLMATDRCDWPLCPSQAYVRAIHPTEEAWHGILNQDLLFCAHHFNRALKTGSLDEWSVIDERAKLTS